MPGQNTHQNEVEDFKSGKIYHLGELSDNLRTWLLLFHTFSWAWESEFRILSSSQLWTRSPAIGRKCPRRNIFLSRSLFKRRVLLRLISNDKAIVINRMLFFTWVQVTKVIYVLKGGKFLEAVECEGKLVNCLSHHLSAQARSKGGDL